MSSPALIGVLLATCNGGRYLPLQLASLEPQFFSMTLLRASDVSTEDESFSLLQQWAEAHRDQIEISLSRVSLPLSAKQNFARLLERCETDYIAFCDQDDVWHPDKLKLELAEMQRLEALHPGTPILVHSDLEVVDAELNQLAPSFFDSQGLPRVHESILDQFVMNNVTGCTMLINRAARELALPIPDEAIMHDWWIAAKVRYHGGIIGFVDRPLVKYRQHEGNVVGAKQLGKAYYLREFVRQWGFIKPWWAIYRQARAINPEISLWAVFARKMVLTFRRLKSRKR